MKLNRFRNPGRWVFFFIFALWMLPGRAGAYRPSPRPYQVCMQAMSHLRYLIVYQVDNEKLIKKLEPDPRTARLPLIELVRAGLVKEIPKGAGLECIYCVGPVSLEKALQDGSPEELQIFCLKHGYLYPGLRPPLPEAGLPDIEQKSFLRKSFEKRCQAVGLDPGSFDVDFSRYDPDPDGYATLSGSQVAVLKLHAKFGAWPFALPPLIMAFALVAFPLVRANDRVLALFAALSVVAGTLLLFQLPHLWAFNSYSLDGWGCRYVRFPAEIVGWYTIVHFFLIVFSLVQIPIYLRASAGLSLPLSCLLVSIVGIFLGLNALSGLYGLLYAAGSYGVLTRA